MTANGLEQAVNAHRKGDLEAAERGYRELLERDPKNPQVLGLLGAVAFARKRYDEAEGLFSLALAADPAQRDAAFNLARVDEVRGDVGRAIERYRTLVERDPSDLPAWNRLGLVLAEQGEYADAADAIGKLLWHAPQDRQAAYLLGAIEDAWGRACVDAGDFARAETLFRSAASHIPNRADPHANLSFLYHILGRVDDAVAAGRRAVKLERHHVQAHVNLAVSLLLGGDFRHGLREYEWRPVEREFGALMRWDGGDLRGGRLLVAREQGLGDFVLLSRFFPELRARGARVCVELPSGARELFAGFDGIDEPLDTIQTDLSGFAAYLPVGSIPYALELAPDRIPAPPAYLQADPATTAAFAAAFAREGARRTVGIAWAGSPEHAMDRHRSVSLDAFAPLAQTGGITWVSLQKGDRESDEAPAGMRLLRIGDQLANFADTAAAIAALDLVICVDTSIAHLAGALGKPVWLLNGVGNYWLWGLRQERTPWYPSMRLFHQPAPGDWPGLFAAVARELQR